ncbi:hypothetical protein HDV00_007789 [Rhizophlyctis rosea]|nr:hypothetical protein HDV00_007789 [Rhizophlyctis rosea]
MAPLTSPMHNLPEELIREIGQHLALTHCKSFRRTARYFRQSIPVKWVLRRYVPLYNELRQIPAGGPDGQGDEFAMALMKVRGWGRGSSRSPTLEGQLEGGIEGNLRYWIEEATKGRNAEMLTAVVDVGLKEYELKERDDFLDWVMELSECLKTAAEAGWLYGVGVITEQVYGALKLGEQPQFESLYELRVQSAWNSMQIPVEVAARKKHYGMVDYQITTVKRMCKEYSRRHPDNTFQSWFTQLFRKLLETFPATENTEDDEVIRQCLMIGCARGALRDIGSMRREDGESVIGELIRGEDGRVIDYLLLFGDHSITGQAQVLSKIAKVATGKKERERKWSVLQIAVKKLADIASEDFRHTEWWCKNVQPLFVAAMEKVDEGVSSVQADFPVATEIFITCLRAPLLPLPLMMSKWSRHGGVLSLNYIMSHCPDMAHEHIRLLEALPNVARLRLLLNSGWDANELCNKQLVAKAVEWWDIQGFGRELSYCLEIARVYDHSVLETMVDALKSVGTLNDWTAGSVMGSLWKGRGKKMKEMVVITDAAFLYTAKGSGTFGEPIPAIPLGQQASSPSSTLPTASLASNSTTQNANATAALGTFGSTWEDMISQSTPMSLAPSMHHQPQQQQQLQHPPNQSRVVAGFAAYASPTTAIGGGAFTLLPSASQLVGSTGVGSGTLGIGLAISSADRQVGLSPGEIQAGASHQTPTTNDMGGSDPSQWVLRDEEEVDVWE